MTLKAKIESEIGMIFFARPEKKNALTRDMWLQLSHQLDDYCGDNRVRAVILTGTGDSFSSGDDIREMLELETYEEAIVYFQAHKQAFKSLLECPKPVIAAVEGYALGGGAEILLAVDLAIASRRSIIGFPEARIGLIPPVLTTLGVHVLGYRRAKALALTGALLGGGEAREIGLVSLTSMPGKTLDIAVEVARMTMQAPLESHRASKKLAFLSLPDIYEALDRALEELARRVVSGDAKDRMRKFLEHKLPPSPTL